MTDKKQQNRTDFQTASSFYPHFLCAGWAFGKGLHPRFTPTFPGPITGFRLDSPQQGVQDRRNPFTPRSMKIELTPANSAALTKYAALAGHTPTEFLNEYLQSNMVTLFENIRSGELESHLASLEYRTKSDAERVIAWMEKRLAERSGGRTALEAETCENKGICWIEAKTTANGLTYPV